jgi:hypothetical protein
MRKNCSIIIFARQLSAPFVFIRLSASFQEKESRTEKKGKRREENREKKGERGKQYRRTPDKRRQRKTKKKGIASRPGKLSFIHSFCIHSELHLLLFK